MTNSSLILWRPVPQSVSSPNFHLEPLERRYFLSAQVDPSFGDHGHVFAPGPPGGGNSYYVTVQSDGRILLSGDSSNSHDMGQVVTVLQRLLPDGALDPSFHLRTNLNTYAPLIRLQDDGKILLVADQDLIRLQADGRLDPTFHYVPAPPLQDGDLSNYFIRDAALLSDGRILTIGGHYGQDVHLQLLSRYNPDGSPDLTFGQSGVVMPLPEGAWSEAIRATGDGHLLIITELPLNSNAAENDLWQLNADGSIDPTFGDAGRIVLPAATWDSDPFRYSQDPLLLQPDGKIIVGLTREWSDGNSLWLDDELIRLTPSGIIDPTFANAGIAELPPDSEAVDMLLQSDGKFVIVLGAVDPQRVDIESALPTDSPAIHQGASLLRLNPDGTSDTSFGPDGRFRIDGTQQGDSQAAVQGDKIILLAGDTAAPSADPNQFFHVVRVWDPPATTPDGNPIVPQPTTIIFPPLWSEKPIFQDATDDLDWSQLEQPWD